jgi:hypothetical protein
MREPTRIMYLENKSDGIVGPAGIGRVAILNSGKTLYYRGQRCSSLRGKGFKANYFDQESKEHYWISGCKKDGSDALYSTAVETDENVREEYWTVIRSKPEFKNVASFKSIGKYSK